MIGNIYKSKDKKEYLLITGRKMEKGGIWYGVKCYYDNDTNIGFSEGAICGIRIDVLVRDYKEFPKLKAKLLGLI